MPFAAESALQSTLTHSLTHTHTHTRPAAGDGMGCDGMGALRVWFWLRAVSHPWEVNARANLRADEHQLRTTWIAFCCTRRRTLPCSRKLLPIEFLREPVASMKLYDLQIWRTKTISIKSEWFNLIARLTEIEPGCKFINLYRWKQICSGGFHKVLLRRDHWQKTARLILLKVGQSTWKNPIRFMVKRKKGVASHFWAHKIHVKELIWLAQSQCYGIGRKKLIWGCQRSLLNYTAIILIN